MDVSTSDMRSIIEADYSSINHEQGAPGSRNDGVDSNKSSNQVCKTQCVGGRFWFLTFLCVAAMGQSMSVNGLIGLTISSIERRFALTSSQTAWITSAYELAGIPALLVVGFIGSRIRRPIWIASGLVILVVGIVIYALPHFVAPLYRYDVYNDTGSLCSVKTSSLTQCEVDAAASASIVDDSGKQKYIVMFLVASVLMGIGSVPLFVLGVTYIDDSSAHSTAAFDLGLFYSMSVLGPVLAFIGGGYLLTLYDDFNRVNSKSVDLSDTDPRWVGAWWLGFLVSLSLVAITIPAIACFPPNPPGLDDRKESPETEDDVVASARDVELDLSTVSWREIPRSARSLLTNWTFVFTALYGTCDAMLIDSFQTFGPKYLQQQFGLTASTAGIIFGVTAVPGGVGGFLIGSYLIKRLTLSCRRLLLMNFVLSVVCLLTIFAFTIQCDTAPLAGVTDVQHGRYGNFNASCNENCSCNNDWFDPVCGDNDVTYFSACYAGCKKGSSQLGYSDCSCLPMNMGGLPDSMLNTSRVVRGVCSVATCQLWRLVFFVILFFIAMFLVFFCGIFHVSVILRVVPYSHRSLSYAVDWMLQRLIGAMPGPVLFGYVLDRSCLLWENKCETSGACLYYDNHQMAWLMMAVCAACKSFSVIFGLVAWRIFSTGPSEELPTCASEGLRTLSFNRVNRVSIFDRFHTSVIADSAFVEDSELNSVDVNHANRSVI